MKRGRRLLSAGLPILTIILTITLPARSQELATGRTMLSREQTGKLIQES